MDKRKIDENNGDIHQEPDPKYRKIDKVIDLNNNPTQPQPQQQPINKIPPQIQPIQFIPENNQRTPPQNIYRPPINNTPNNNIPPNNMRMNSPNTPQNLNTPIRRFNLSSGYQPSPLRNFDPNYQNIPQNETPLPQTKFETPSEYIEKIKMTYSKNPEVYYLFLDLMKEIKTKKIDTPIIVLRVKELFKGNPTLILGFNHFLPPGYKISLSPSELKIYEKEMKQKQSNEPIVINLNQPLSTTIGSPIVPAPPPGVQSTQINPSTPQPQQQAPQKLAYFRNLIKKIRLRFNQTQTLKSFFDILNNFNKDQMSIKNIHSQVSQLFKYHPDLVEEFSELLPNFDPNNKLSLNKKKSNIVRMSPYKPEYGEILERIRKNLNNELLYNDIVKNLFLFNNGMMELKEFLVLTRDILVDLPQLFYKLEDLINTNPLSTSNTYHSPLENTLFVQEEDEEVIIPQKFIDIDYNTVHKFGPSYRLLPKSYEHPSCTGRKPFDQQYLNDNLVSIPTGTEDEAPFKASRKNQYEEVLFEVEDDRYELDILIEANTSCINFFEPIRTKISENENQISTFTLTEKLDIMHQRAIERVYGENGPEILDSLYQNTSVAIPVILSRLKQKDREWRKSRRDWNKVWRDVVEKNHFKSLDQHSTTFKNAFAPSISSKVLLSDITKKYHNHLKEVALGNQYLSSQLLENNHFPHSLMTYKSYQLNFVFNAIESIVQHVAQKEIYKFDYEKLQFFYQSFVQPFFGYTRESTPSFSCFDENPAQKNKQKIKLDYFFGNRSCYIFFRLYWILFNCLESSILWSEDEEDPSKMYDQFATNKPPVLSEKNVRNFETYINLIKEYLSNDIDSVKFEDDCREMFGLNCCLLFSADKIIMQLCKKISHLLSNEFSSKLFVLYNFEYTLSSSNINTYCSDTVNLFQSQGQSHKRCFFFRLERNIIPKEKELIQEDKKASSNVSFSIFNNRVITHPKIPNKLTFVPNPIKINHSSPNNGVVSEKDSHLLKWGIHFTIVDNINQCFELQLELMKEKWDCYVDNFLYNNNSSSSFNISISKNKVFLNRNKSKVEKALGKIPSSLNNFDIYCGLECKICMSTFRLFYIKDTFDYMKRKRSNDQSSKIKEISHRRKEKFSNWIENKLK